MELHNCRGAIWHGSGGTHLVRYSTLLLLGLSCFSVLYQLVVFPCQITRLCIEQKGGVIIVMKKEVGGSMLTQETLNPVSLAQASVLPGFKCDIVMICWTDLVLYR